MFNDRSLSSSSYHRNLPSGAISDWRNIKFSNISSNHHSSTERLNSSLNRGKDGIFRPKSIFSVATEIDFESSSHFPSRNLIKPIQNNPRLAHLHHKRHRETSLTRSSDSSRYSSSPTNTGRSTPTRSTDFYSNFNDNLSYLNSRSGSSSIYSNNLSSSPSSSSYGKISYVANSYKFTTAYHAPKYRDRPLLSNLNLKFGVNRNENSTTLVRNGAGSSGSKGSTSSHKGSTSSTTSSHNNSVSSNDASISKPTLERNKFLIKFREHDKPLNQWEKRHNSISWDIPYDYIVQHNQSSGHNHQLPDPIKEVENESENYIGNGESSDILNVDGNFEDNNNGHCLTCWKDSLNLNEDKTIELKEPKESKDDVDLNNEWNRIEPLLLKENLVTNGYVGEIYHQEIAKHCHQLTPLRSSDIVVAISKSRRQNVNDSEVKDKKDEESSKISANKNNQPLKTSSLKLLKRKTAISTTVIDIPYCDQTFEFKFSDLHNISEPLKSSAEQITTNKQKCTKINANKSNNDCQNSLLAVKTINVEGNEKQTLKSLKKSATSQLPLPEVSSVSTTSLNSPVAKKKPKSNKVQPVVPESNQDISKPKSEVKTKKVPEKLKLDLNTSSNKPESLATSPKELKSNKITDKNANKSSIKDLSPKTSPTSATIKLPLRIEINNEPETKRKEKENSITLNLPFNSSEIKVSQSPKDCLEVEEAKTELLLKETTPKSPKLPNASPKSKFSFNKIVADANNQRSTVEKDKIKSTSPTPKSPKSPKAVASKTINLEQTKLVNVDVAATEKSTKNQEEQSVMKRAKSKKINESKEINLTKVIDAKLDFPASSPSTSTLQLPVQLPKDKTVKENIQNRIPVNNSVDNGESKLLKKNKKKESEERQAEKQETSNSVKKELEKDTATTKKKKIKSTTTNETSLTSLKDADTLKPNVSLTPKTKSENESISVSQIESTSTRSNSEKQQETDQSKLIKISSNTLDPFQRGHPHRKKIRFREYGIDDFKFLTVLGRGSFGKVLLAELCNHDCHFAVKCLKKQTVIEDDDVESIMIERKVLAYGTSHPFICKLFCTFQTECHLFFAMELCSGGDLMFHVQKEGKFPENKVRFYASEILCAIWFLHKRGIIYRDLKLDNVMVANDGHIRLVDFGMCVGKMYREEFLPSNFCGTPEYMAPEIIKGVKYNHSVDYWALGVVIYEMCVGTSPFHGTDEDELLWNVCNTEVHYPKFLSEQVKNLCVLLLKKNPLERLGLPTSPHGDIVTQPWFHGVQWDLVEKCKLKPPFIPQLAHDADVSYFDQYFTKETPCISICDKLVNENDQLLFQGFNYTNHRMTD